MPRRRDTFPRGRDGPKVRRTLVRGVRIIAQKPLSDYNIKQVERGSVSWQRGIQEDSMADWFPSRRDDIIHMADIWARQLEAKGVIWGVALDKIAEFKNLTAAAKALLTEVKSGNRNDTGTEQCGAMFRDLEIAMRFLKESYFNSPPRANSEMAALLLSAPDELSAAILRSDVAPGLSLHNASGGILCRMFTEAAPADHRSTDHFFIKWGVKPKGRWATGEEAAADGRLLTRLPIRARDLPEHFSTGRKTHTLTFSPADAGMEVYATACWQTPRNEDGPYCPIISKIIA